MCLLTVSPRKRPSFVVIVNFLSHREESGLQPTIIFLALHDANRCLTLMFTTVCYLRGHVVLDCKSPEPQVFGTEGTLGIPFVPTTRVQKLYWGVVPDRSVDQVQLCEPSVCHGDSWHKYQGIFGDIPRGLDGSFVLFLEPNFYPWTSTWKSSRIPINTDNVNIYIYIQTCT